MNVFTDNPKIRGIPIVNYFRFIPALKKMTPKLMAGVISLGKGSMKPLHRIDQITLRCFQQKMVVIAHQTPRMNHRLIAYAHLAKATDKQIDILLMFENIATLIPP